MKLQASTSLNDAIKRIAAGHAGAASVVGLLVKEYPDRALDYMHALDRMGIYGLELWKLYYDKCSSSSLVFLDYISAGKK